MKYLSLIICLVFSSYTMADKAKVLIVKGDVTKLAPGMIKAEPVKRGEYLIEDTSIVTSDKSFIRVQFSDKSTMNIRPKSMVVINKMPKKKANMVNLLTGLIKAQVKKTTKKETKTKLVIKTRTAVMGVRGTKFQTMYNASNRSTSLVTVEGNVAMVKEATMKKKIAEIVNKDPSISLNDDIQAIDEVFETSKEVIEVKEGTYSGVAEKVAKPTTPIKIAPVQYNALAKSMGSKKKAEDVMKLGDEKVSDVKSGGVIDFETGLYVEPAKDAKFNEKTGTYELSNDIGKIDSKTGDYIPPKGIKIDPKKGFVLDKEVIAEVSSSEDKDRLASTLSKLNKSTEKQIIVNQNRSNPDRPFFWKWLPEDHKFSFTFRPFSEVQDVKNKNSGSEVTFFTKEADFAFLTFYQKWNEKWSSRVRVGGVNFQLDNSDVKLYEFGSDNDENGFFSIGAAYNLSKKITLSVDLTDKPNYYVVPTQGDGVEVRSNEYFSIDLGVNYQLAYLFEMPVMAFASLNLVPDAQAPQIYNNPGDNGDVDSDFFEFTLGANYLYKVSKRFTLDTSVFYHRSEVTNDDFVFTKNSLGLGANIIWDI